MVTLEESPTYYQIARVLVTACRAYDEDAEKVFTSSVRSRGRKQAMLALCAAFPTYSRVCCARWLNSDKPQSLDQIIKSDLKIGRFDLDTINACLASIGRPSTTKEQLCVERIRGGSVQDRERRLKLAKMRDNVREGVKSVQPVATVSLPSPPKVLPEVQSRQGKAKPESKPIVPSAAARAMAEATVVIQARKHVSPKDQALQKARSVIRETIRGK